MTPRAHVRALVLLLAVTWPAASRAFDYRGRIGLLYERTQVQSQDARLDLPRLRLDGEVAARGAILTPQYGSWEGDLRLERWNDTYAQYEDETDLIAYDATVSLFERPGTVMGVRAGASRGRTQVTTGNTGARVTGSTLEETYHAQMRLGREAPVLRVGGWQREARNQGFDRPEDRERTQVLDVGTQVGPGPFDVAIDYQGRWNEGSFDILNYALQTLNVRGSSTIAPGASAYLTGRYMLREPSTVSASNPRFEENSVVSGVQLGTDASRATVQYAYVHSFFSAPAIEERERIRQVASVWSELGLSPSWVLRPTADFTLAQERIAASEASGWAGSAGAVLRWQRRNGGSELWVEAGPRVGMLAPASGEDELGYGGQARARASRSNGPSQLGIDYSVDYQTNLEATRGFALRQTLQADAAALVAGTLRARLVLSASATQRHEEFLGDGASRDVLLTGTFDWRRLRLQVDAGLREDVSPAVGSTVSGGGLILPAGFDTRSSHVTAVATVPLHRTLWLLLRGRIGQAEGPDVPTERESAAEGMLTYAVGQLRLSIEDRYTTGGRPGQERSSNYVGVRFSRTFGGN